MDREALVKAVIDALTVGDDDKRQFWTTQELCSSLDWGAEKVRGALIALKDEGKLGVTRKTVTNLSGYVTRVPAYYLIDESTNTEQDEESSRGSPQAKPGPGDAPGGDAV